MNPAPRMQPGPGTNPGPRENHGGDPSALTVPDSSRDDTLQPEEVTIEPQLSNPGNGRDMGDSTSSVLQRLEAHAFKESRYRFKGEIARGGMGAILRVWDEDLRRNMAMKVVLGPDVRGGSAGQIGPRILARFLEEAQVTGQLDHPGIVPVHELGLDNDGRVYFTMRLVKGRNLLEIFKLVHAGAEDWSQTRALMVMLKVCEAMAFAHKKGVIHRDLKPANIMVGRFGEVYVMDWGLARVLGHRDLHDIRPEAETDSMSMAIESDRKGSGDHSAEALLYTMDGDVIGTPAYMPPEQARGDIEQIDPRSDVYAIGAILYHLFSGQMPYTPAKGTVSQRIILKWVLEEAPRPILKLNHDVPAELVAICDKAMQRDPRLRYADMSEVAEDLRAYLEHRVVRAYQTGAVAELRKWIERNRGLAAAIATAAVLLVLGLVTSLTLKARADTNYALAASRRDDVLRLSAFQELSDLRAEANQLWPPWPQNLARYDACLEEAHALVAGLHPRPEEQDAGHLARLAALQARVLPRTEAETEAERRTHPEYGELERLLARQAALARAQAVRDGGAPPDEPELEEEDLPDDFYELNRLAWTLVDPELREYGHEARGLALARVLQDRVEDDAMFARAVETLAWALHANGRDEEALEEIQVAVAMAPPAVSLRLERSAAELERAVAALADGGGTSALEELAREVARLESVVAQPRDVRFEDENDRWWYNQLTTLVAEIEAFSDPETGLIAGRSPEFGLGLTQRRDWAATVEERTVTGKDAARRWAGASALLSDPRECPEYGGLTLEPQLGLLPIGRDPDSGLWEFAHPLTGTVPVRDEAGRLLVDEETCVVFVLVPGGSFTMGAQRVRGQPNFDPNAHAGEGPPHRVKLSPFFISKYELTQGQWMRFHGTNPSYWQGVNTAQSLLHPVEQVSWIDCMTMLGRMGLTLPTEAQWEYAARAGTTSIWWTGNVRDTLIDRVNLVDKAAGAFAAWGLTRDWMELDDGWAVHAPVDTFVPNPFGLHNVHGNVWEWCIDSYDAGFYGRSPTLDPVNPPYHSRERILRGGSFGSSETEARAAGRQFSPFDDAGSRLGLRPVRLLESSG